MNQCFILIFLFSSLVFSAVDPILGLQKREESIVGNDLAVVQGVIRDENGNPQEHFAVWVKIPDHDPSREPLVQDMVQRGKEFHPRLLIAPVNTKVWFPNDDPFFHNVFSYNPVKNLDLGKYKGKGKPVLFEKAGVYPIGCEIHPWMAAHIVIVKTPFYGKTGVTGEVFIRDLAPGQHDFFLWSPRLKKGIKTTEIVRPGLNKIQWTIERSKFKKRRRKKRRKKGTDSRGSDRKTYEGAYGDESLYSDPSGYR